MPRPLVFLLFAGLAGACAAAQTPQVTALLKQLDAASVRFKAVQADVKYDEYTLVARAHDLSSGTMFIERAGSGETMGAAVKDDQSTNPRIINYGGGTLQVFSPGTGTDDVFKAGANQAKYESFLTLGFGGSGRDLANAWNIHDAGMETIDGVKTEKLELTGKDPSVAGMFKQVVLWIDPARGVSLKQVFLQPSGDSRTALYTNIQLNPAKIDKKPYTVSKSAKKVVH